MGVYLYPSGTEKELKNAYIGGVIPESWLLGYRPLQSDLLDASWNWKDGSWYSWTWSFSANAGKTGARVTWQPHLTTQHVITSLTYESSPVTACGRICYNTAPTASISWTWLMSSSNWGWKWQTIGTRQASGQQPYATIWGNNLQISATVPTINTWYFWAATNDGTNTKAYLNWSLTNTGTAWTVTAWWVWKLWCAMIDAWGTRNNWTDWWVRHCAIYNRALSADEIMQFYTLTA